MPAAGGGPGELDEPESHPNAATVTGRPLEGHAGHVSGSGAWEAV